MATSQPGSLTSPRMQVIIDQYADHWIPFNQEIVNELLVLIKVGDNPQERFVKAVQKDNALFTYCVKDILTDTEHTISLSDQERRSPCVIIRKASQKQLIAVAERARLLQEKSLDSSRKLAAETRDVLTHKMQEWQLASTAAQSLCDNFNADRDYVYAVTVFRYLGEALLAWANADVYLRALQYYKEGKCNVDEALTREFGFSPHLLCSCLAQQWGLHVGFVNAMQQTPIHQELRDLNYPHEFVRRMGEIGDAAARSVYREYYPNIDKSYDKFRGEMEESLGIQSVRRFEEGIIKAMPEERREDSFLSAYKQDEEPLAHHAGLTLFKKNRYVGRCTKPLQDALKEFYGRIESSETARQHMKVLLRDVIPESGFKECCVYLLDKSSMSLIPRYTAGTRPPQAYDSARGSMDYSQKNPVTQAFFSNYPTIDYFDKDNAAHPFVLGPLGNDPKIGVMYLEVSDTCQESDLVGSFRALGTAVYDCLAEDD